MASYSELPVRRLANGKVVAGYSPGEFAEYDAYSEPYQPQKGGEYWQDRLTTPDPAAGNEWHHTCPGNYIEEILLVRFRLVTSAVVANRDPFLQILDQNGSEVWAIPPSQHQAAGATSIYSYSSSTGASAPFLTNRSAYAMTRIYLFPQWSIGTVTALIDVGDQYSQIAILCNRWNNRPRRIAARH
jgi:hypothetical protein